MATVNLGLIKFRWQGAYAGGTAYVKDDVVSYNGSSYVCILASTGNLPTNTTYWNVMAQGIDGGGLQSIQTFTSSGTYTKPSGINKIKVIVTGGGGGGSGTPGNTVDDEGGGGSAGGTAIKVIDATSITTETVTVGSGGSAGSATNNGGTGGTSSFGSHCSATGGTGGRSGEGTLSDATPGVGSSGDINIRGGYGAHPSANQAVDSMLRGSLGGSSFWGGSTRPSLDNNFSSGDLSANNTGAYGAGGGSGAGAVTTGGAGVGGIIVVEEYK